MYHPLLTRQLRKASLNAAETPADVASWVAFLDGVQRAYVQFDQDRELVERSLSLSSAEMRELYDELARHNDRLEREVALRTKELEEARENDRRRMDQLGEIVQQRTAELRHAAQHDRLTALPNRALFFDRLHQTIQRKARDPAFRFSLLFIDFDHFKQVNDTLGHHYGDQLLCSIANRLTCELRHTDVVSGPDTEKSFAARLGGDEFCVLLDDLREDVDAEAVAARLLARLSQPYVLGDRTVQVTASIGLAHGTQQHKSGELLIRDADIAMYRAKHFGRGRVVVFDQEMQKLTLRRFLIESQLRGAPQRGELFCLYQPIFSLQSGEITGVESLVRWRHPELGLVPPTDFIPLAEDTGEIWEIGASVLQSAARQLAVWLTTPEGRRLRFLSVNVSPKQLYDERFVPLVREVIQKTEVPPERLTLEITESSLTEEPKLARSAIDAVRQMGLRVYLDDFGAGYSSFSALHKFPLDGLKLDRGFLQTADSSRRAAACIHSVVSLARMLEMDLITEGIESIEQIAMLQALDCEQGQGFVFSRPLPPSDLLSRMRRPGTGATAMLAGVEA